MTEDGSYYTIGEELTLFGEKEITTEEIEYYNSIVANKFLVSQWILEEDYWRVLFGDNLPPDDLPHDPENPDGTISPESSNYYE